MTDPYHSHVKFQTKNIEISNKLSKHYIDIFQENGINVVIETGSAMEDFYKMIYSPVLVSLNPSSFSFAAGISKSPDNYISCNLGHETDQGTYNFQKYYDWIVIDKQPLLHSEIINYHDFDELSRKIGT